MCGIAGIQAYRDSLVDRAELQSMCDALAHRGPDGEGLWIDGGRRVGLAHRRLSIIDLSERGTQPMHSPDGRLAISFNGEIYNYRALRRGLEQRGVHFRSDSDTEVLLQLYAEHGEEMLGRLRGMFAFALADRRRRRMLVARDPYGIKPLYVADDGRVIRIASEVKALVRVGAAGGVSPSAKVAFLLMGSVPEPHCWREGVRALPAGHYAWIDDGHGLGASRPYASVTRAWFDAAQGTAQASDEVVCDALRDSVKHHLVADVPVGAFLSAGIDSSALVALIREMQGDIRTVTITADSFRGTAEDEAPVAERVAKRYGATHETHVVSASDFRAAAPQVLAAMDQPSIDGFNTWLVSRAAARGGLKVAVSGLGGDELFGGYASFVDVPRWHALARHPARIPGVGRAVRRAALALRLPDKLGMSPKLAGAVEFGGTYPGAYLLRRGLFMPWELPAIIGVDEARAGLGAFDPLRHVSNALSPEPGLAFARVAALEATLYMRNQLLRDADWASMAHGLEVRVPLVDYTLLTRVAAAACRQSGSKGLLARCPTPALPSWLVGRKKTGFALPLAAWLEDPAVGLDDWRRLPSLSRPGVHWSRRLAYTLCMHAAHTTV